MTTRFVARLVTQGNLRKPTNICMRIEKHEIAMIRSDAIIIMMNTSAAIGEGRMHVKQCECVSITMRNPCHLQFDLIVAWLKVNFDAGPESFPAFFKVGGI
jgi:hypothetical protein